MSNRKPSFVVIVKGDWCTMCCVMSRDYNGRKPFGRSVGLRRSRWGYIIYIRQAIGNRVQPWYHGKNSPAYTSDLPVYITCINQLCSAAYSNVLYYLHKERRIHLQEYRIMRIRHLRYLPCAFETSMTKGHHVKRLATRT